MDDYRENKRHMANTCFIDAGMYNNNWFHYDNFVEKSNNLDDENCDKGLSLEFERKYDFVASMVSGNTLYNWYTIILCQRLMHNTKDGIRYS